MAGTSQAVASSIEHTASGLSPGSHVSPAPASLQPLYSSPSRTMMLAPAPPAQGPRENTQSGSEQHHAARMPCFCWLCVNERHVLSRGLNERGTHHVMICKATATQCTTKQGARSTQPMPSQHPKSCHISLLQQGQKPGFSAAALACV